MYSSKREVMCATDANSLLFNNFKRKQVQTAACLECCLLYMFPLSDVCSVSNMRVHRMEEKVRLFLPAAFNQTKIGEQLSSLRNSQQSVLKFFASLNQGQGV